MDESDLQQAVRAAAARADVRAAVERVYGNLQREIDVRRPLCSATGRCCHFDEYGHRLYVTTMELAAFVAALRTHPPASPPAESPVGSASADRLLAPSPLQVLSDHPAACPFQVEKLCGVHAIRPFGCRVFFCDATATAWQNEQYERFHDQLKQLHENLAVPYFYVEWRQALHSILSAAVGAASAERLRPSREE